MAYRIVAERENETVRMDRISSLMAVAKARVWASEGWDVTIIVRDEEKLPPVDPNLVAGLSLCCWLDVIGILVDRTTKWKGRPGGRPFSFVT